MYVLEICDVLVASEFTVDDFGSETATYIYNQPSNPKYEDNISATLNNNIFKYKINESSGVTNITIPNGYYNIPDLLNQTHNLLAEKPKKRLWG